MSSLVPNAWPFLPGTTGVWPGRDCRCLHRCCRCNRSGGDRGRPCDLVHLAARRTS